MSKLVICAVLDLDQLEEGALSVASALSDEFKYASRVGQPVLVANMGGKFASAYVALGELAGFVSEPDGTNAVHLRNVTLFPDPMPMRDVPVLRSNIFEISDQAFQAILDLVIDPTSVHEDEPGFQPALPGSVFLQQLRREQDDRCSFSGARSDRLEAVIIRPMDQGGHWHISNFVLLDKAPALDFRGFGWSVGPRFQILLNAHAVGQDGVETASPKGILDMPIPSLMRLDRTALDWHREQFFARLR